MDAPSTWQIPPVDLGLAARLAARLGVSRVTAEVLARRGFAGEAAARAFLHPDFLFHSPYLLPGIAEAKAAVDRALKRGELIAVHGDYDADGITATFLLTEVLRELGANVVWRVPNRFSDGYGVSARAVEALAEQGARLLVTVDCGVTAVAEVARAQELGMEVVVTDHHEPKGELPGCVVADPRLGGYPFPHLAGVGVVLKLAHALLEERRGDRVELPLALRPYTDVVALGTVADVVPLLDENRLLVKMGLGRLQSAPRPGLAALLEVSGTAPADVAAATLGFRLGPRLNAAGRLEDAAIAIELLAAADRTTALPLALKLNELNIARQDIEAAMVAEATGMVSDPPPAGLVLSSPDWHEGVVGIVASRVVERVNRPAILLSEKGDEASGSGRSIPGFDLLAAVAACSGPLHSFGGHRAACGLRLPRKAVPAFREAFAAYAAEHLRPADLVRRQPVDAVACGDELTLALADELELFGPHGLDNPRVTLLVHGAEINSPRLTRNGKHMQASVCADGASCSAIRFNVDGLNGLEQGARFDIPLVLAKNAYNGVVSGQVEVKGLYRIDPEPDHDVCGTACAAECPELVHGDAFWRLIDELDLAPLLGAAPAGEMSDSPAAGASAAFAGSAGSVGAAAPAAPAGADDGAAAAGGVPRPRPAAAAPCCRRSPRWWPRASGSWCSSPTSAAVGRCWRAICRSRRSSSRPCTSTAPARRGACGRRRRPMGRASSWRRRSPPRCTQSWCAVLGRSPSSTHRSGRRRSTPCAPPPMPALVSISFGERVKYTLPARSRRPTTTSTPPRGVSTGSSPAPRGGLSTTSWHAGSWAKAAFSPRCRPSWPRGARSSRPVWRSRGEARTYSRPSRARPTSRAHRRFAYGTENPQDGTCSAA